VSELVADVLTVRRFADLFARVRRPFIRETPDTWLTRKTAMTDGMIAAHLCGDVTLGVRMDARRGGGRIAPNIALEVDFGPRDDDLAEVLERIMGEPGLAVVRAVHAAGSDLRIREEAWCFSWSGNRSLHAWLTPREPVKLAAAYAVATAIRDGVDARIATCGLHVCHVWPTNPDHEGMGLRLPWGRHTRTGESARFVNLYGGVLYLRDPYPADAGYLVTLEHNLLEPEVLMTAATLERNLVPVRPSRIRPAETLAKTTGSKPTGGRVERSLPMQTRRIARPCILHLLERGVPEDYRHAVALLLRAELVRCDLTLADAWPVYLRYAAACAPAWEEADARTDLEANWSKTDPALRHLCPGRGDPSNVTRYLHERCCVGAEACGWRRAGAALVAWEEHLSADARALYLSLCIMESAVHHLRPGDELHTTAAGLMERSGLGRKDLERARDDLLAAGLLTYSRTGRPDGVGTPGGGVHSLYRRIIPVPDPPKTPDPDA